MMSAKESCFFPSFLKLKLHSSTIEEIIKKRIKEKIKVEYIKEPLSRIYFSHSIKK